MSNYRFPRSLMNAGLPRLTVAATVALGTLLAGGPAFAAGHHETRADSQSGTSSQKLLPGSAQMLLQIAEKQIGVTENASGGGTPFHDWYMSSPRAKETVARDGGNVRAYANAPWCAMFVSWVGEKAGLRSTVGWDAYTVTWANWFKDNGRWGTVAKPGSVVYFAWGANKTIGGIDHMGVVKKDNGDGTITTIEGNTGNGKVEQRVRPKSDVVGYGYPEYKA
ncbi:CHAP domain-containing protein [Streptosporangium sp. NPDC002544]|uniref:CHAP domain-containing protein n=1 Tax=Streptosporangium sp. NPDC002544 TaxID=3154538 RepID=UPI003327554D